MRSILKVTKTINKVYAAIIVGSWFFIGIGELVKATCEHPDKGVRM